MPSIGDIIDEHVIIYDTCDSLVVSSILGAFRNVAITGEHVVVYCTSVRLIVST